MESAVRYCLLVLILFFFLELATSQQVNSFNFTIYLDAKFVPSSPSSTCGLDTNFPCNSLQQALEMASILQNGSTNGTTIFYFKPGTYTFQKYGNILHGNLYFIGEEILSNPLQADVAKFAQITSLVEDQIIFTEPTPFIYSPSQNTSSTYSIRFENLIFSLLNYPLFRPDFSKNPTDFFSVSLLNCLIDTYRGTMLRTFDLDDQSSSTIYRLSQFELENVVFKSNSLKPNDPYFTTLIDINFGLEIKLNAVTFYNSTQTMFITRINDSQNRTISLNNITVLFCRSFSRRAIFLSGHSISIHNLTIQNSAFEWENRIIGTLFISNVQIADTILYFKTTGVMTIGQVTNSQCYASALHVINSAPLYPFLSLNVAGAIVDFSTLQRVTIVGGSFLNSSANDGLIRAIGVDSFNITQVNFENIASQRTAAITLRFSTAAINNCNFKNITSSSGGGIMAEFCNSLLVRYCTFDSNRADFGSAIYLDSIYTRTKTVIGFGAIIEYCTFHNNQAKRGGALFLTYQVLIQINFCEFTNNIALEDGGSIYSNANSIQLNLSIRNPGFLITFSKFSNNQAINRGGVLYTLSPKSMYSITHSEFQNNSALSAAVAYFEINENIVFSDCQFVSNIAKEHAGCIAVAESKLLTLQRCFVQHCQSLTGNGGVIYTIASDVLFSHVEAIHNIAGINGSVLATKYSPLHTKKIVMDTIKFYSNIARESGTLYLEQLERVTIANAEFFNNSAYISAGITLIGSCHAVQLTRSKFVNNTAFSYSILYQIVGNVIMEQLCNTSLWEMIHNSQPLQGTNPIQWNIMVQIVSSSSSQLQQQQKGIQLGDEIQFQLQVWDAYHQLMNHYYPFVMELESSQWKLSNFSTTQFIGNSFTSHHQQLQIIGITSDFPSLITISTIITLQQQQIIIHQEQLSIPFVAMCPYNEHTKQVIDYIPYSGFWECVSATCNYQTGAIAKSVFGTFSILMLFFIILNALHYLVWIVVMIRKRIYGFVPSFWSRLCILLLEFVLHCFMFIIGTNYLLHNVGLINSDSQSWVMVAHTFDILHVLGITFYTNGSYAITILYCYLLLQIVGISSLLKIKLLVILFACCIVVLTLCFGVGLVITFATYKDWLFTTTSTQSFTVSFFLLWFTTTVGYTLIVILLLIWLVWFYVTLCFKRNIKQLLLYSTMQTTIQLDKYPQQQKQKLCTTTTITSSSSSLLLSISQWIVAPFALWWGVTCSRLLFVIVLSVSECRIGIFFGFYSILTILSLPLPWSIVWIKPLPQKKVHSSTTTATTPILRDSWQELKNMLPDSYILQYDQLHILSQLGSGAQGTVYLCEYSGAKVAAKMFTINYMGNADLDQFYRETAALLQYANHPNIIRLIGISEEKNSVCIVTEYCKNGNLGMYLETHPQLDFKTKCDILEGISAGMKHLHHIPIIHRDLKCENILLDDSLQPKIADFGFSKVVKNQENQTMNIGTASFVAPEILRSAAFYDRSSNNYNNSSGNSSNSSGGGSGGGFTSSANNNSSKGKKSELHRKLLEETDSTTSNNNSNLLYDERVDVFSFGMIMYCVLCCTPRPYGALFDLDIIMKISTNKTFRPNLSADAVKQVVENNQRWYVDLMERCWHWNPNERPSFDEIYSILCKRSL